MGIALLASASGAGAAGAQGASDGWPQFQGGPTHPGSAPDGPRPPFREVWFLEARPGGPTGTMGLSAPVAADDTVVVLAPDAVIALGPDGADRWRIDRRPGPTVAPAIVGSGPDALVVFPEGFGPNAPGLTPSPSPSPTASSTPGGSSPTPTAAGAPVELVAVALADGSERWRTPLPAASRSGVTATEGALYVAGTDGSVSALDPAAGAIRWSVRVGGSIIAPIAATEDRVLVSALGSAQARFSLVALDPADGRVLWRYEPPGASTLGSAVAADEELAYLGLEDRTVRAVALDDGVERWSARLNAVVNPLASPVLVDDAVVVVDIGGQVYRLRRGDGVRLWDHALNVGVLRGPAVVSDRYVLVASSQGELLAVELDGGELVWRASLATGVLRSLAVTDDLVLAVRGGARSGLVALAHDEGGSLIRVQSPTVFRPRELGIGLVLGALPAALAALGIGVLVRRRLGSGAEELQPVVDPLEGGLEGGEVGS